MEDKIFDIVTDLLRRDISKTEAIDKLLILHNVRDLLLDFADYSENDKTSEATDECVDNYLDQTFSIWCVAPQN